MFSTWIIILFLLPSIVTVQLNDLFPFGHQVGDSIIDQNYTTTIPLHLPYEFPYFDHFYTQIVITKNGLISFNPSRYYYYSSPRPFPLYDNSSIVTAFWHRDVGSGSNDTENLVYYQIYNNTSSSNSTMTVFNKANHYVRRFFPQQRLFKSKMVITSTWYYIGYETNETNRLNNTFQMVLTTDADRSFVFFLYHDLQWANRYNNNYSNVQAGFYSAERNISVILPYSGTNNIIKLVNESNVNVPGLFVYRVDADKINAGGCENNNSTISFRPRIGSQLGSTALIIYGPCFTNETKVKCRFNSSSSSQTINGFVIDKFRAICLTPFAATHGPISVDISLNDGQAYNSASVFTYTPLQFNADEVTVEAENGDQLLGVGERAQVKWRFSETSKDTFPNGTVIDIELWPVNLNEQSQLQKNNTPFILAQNLALTNSARVQIPQGISTCFIRVVARFNTQIYSGLNSVLLIVRSPSSVAVEFCQKWAQQQSEPSTWNGDDLLPCPMTNRQAIQGGFCCYEPEAHCYKGNSHPKNCWLHQGRRNRSESSAVECYISKYSNRHGSGAQCCYDSTGMIITRGTGAGTDDRYRPVTSPVQHFFHDTLPYLQCCLMSTSRETCNTYMRYRPPRRGSNTMGDSGRMWGDPHFGTLDGTSYTFNGHGEYTYLAISNRTSPPVAFDSNGQSYVFMSQIRTMPLSTNSATVTKGFAARSNHAQAESISLTMSPRQYIILRRGNKELEFEENINTLVFPELTITRLDGDNIYYSFSWNIGVTIEINIIEITLPSPQRVLDVGASVAGIFRGRTYGLLGTYDVNTANDLRNKNGSIISSNASLERIHHDFGVTWAIDPSTSLFYYESNQSAQWFYDKNRQFIPSFNDPTNSAAANSSIRSACNIDATSLPSSWTSAQRTCYYDFSVTNDRSFARASLKAGDELLAKQGNSLIYPVFHSSIPLIMNLKEDDSVNLTISASSDSSSSNIVMSAIHLPRNAMFNNSTGAFRWTVVQGDDYLHIQAHDKTSNLIAKHEITFNVAAVDKSNSNSLTVARLFVSILAISVLLGK